MVGTLDVRVVDVGGVETGVVVDDAGVEEVVLVAGPPQEIARKIDTKARHRQTFFTALLIMQHSSLKRCDAKGSIHVKGQDETMSSQAVTGALPAEMMGMWA